MRLSGCGPRNALPPWRKTREVLGVTPGLWNACMVSNSNRLNAQQAQRIHKWGNFCMSTSFLFMLAGRSVTRVGRWAWSWRSGWIGSRYRRWTRRWRSGWGCIRHHRWRWCPVYARRGDYRRTRSRRGRCCRHSRCRCGISAGCRVGVLALCVSIASIKSCADGYTVPIGCYRYRIGHIQ